MYSSIQLDEIRKQRLTLLYKSKREHKLLVSIKVSIKILKNKLLNFFFKFGMYGSIMLPIFLNWDKSTLPISWRNEWIRCQTIDGKMIILSLLCISNMIFAIFCSNVHTLKNIYCCYYLYHLANLSIEFLIRFVHFFFLQ